MKKITLLSVLMTSFFGFAQPSNNAPVPTKAPADVISVYSDSYTNIATNYNPGWGQSGTVNPTFNPGGSGNFVMAYTNFNYQGTNLTAQNAAGMEFLHIDVWSSANPANTILQVSPINQGTGASETLVTINYTQNSWYSVDIPKSAFTGMTWNNIFQMKFAANGAGSTVPANFYLDNIYFWKTPTAIGTDATLSNLQVSGATIPGFSGAALDYNYDLVVGTTVIPQITLATTNDPLATITLITQATAIPGTASVKVTSQNGAVIKTYTVNFTATIPNQSPTPSTPNAEVLNIYSDTAGYTNNWVPDYSFGGYAAIQDLDLGTGVNECIKMNFAAMGYGQGTNAVTNVTPYNWLHFDYFADNDSNQIRFIMIGNNGGVAEYVYELTPEGSDGTLVKGSWQSVNVPLSFFVNKGFTKSTFFQYKLGTTSDLVSKIVFFDNIYLSYNPGTVLNNTNFAASTVNMYPNPTSDNVTITSKTEIETVSIYNVLGQEVMKNTPKSDSVTINIADFQAGVYLVKTTTTDGISTSSRIIKK